jgi:hypothetical protein
LKILNGRLVLPGSFTFAIRTSIFVIVVIISKIVRSKNMGIIPVIDSCLQPQISLGFKEMIEFHRGIIVGKVERLKISIIPGLETGACLKQCPGRSIELDAGLDKRTAGIKISIKVFVI